MTEILILKFLSRLISCNSQISVILMLEHITFLSEVIWNLGTFKQLKSLSISFSFPSNPSLGSGCNFFYMPFMYNTQHYSSGLCLWPHFKSFLHLLQNYLLPTPKSVQAACIKNPSVWYAGHILHIFNYEALFSVSNGCRKTKVVQGSGKFHALHICSV